MWALRRGAEIADRFEIVGREHFETARARGKGVFVLTGHYGCWELAGYPLGRWLGKLYIVARPQNNPYIAAHFERLRESNGNVQIDRDRAGTRMLKVLKKGGAIGVAIDQRVRPSQALLVPFLGRYAWTSRLPAYLATVTGCAAVPMVCVPLPDGRYRMTFDRRSCPRARATTRSSGSPAATPRRSSPTSARAPSSGCGCTAGGSERASSAGPRRSRG